MAEQNKKNTEEVKELDPDQMKDVAGGFVGSDKYSDEEYSKYNVSHQHNIFSKDVYYIDGKKGTQEEAEDRVRKGMEYDALKKQFDR